MFPRQVLRISVQGLLSNDRARGRRGCGRPTRRRRGRAGPE